mmetsp:Transcript_23963/g.38550  ORF Transcript_23963/g.38550 Transcript_23963/m.38550 type:complete len:231 (-) Transcript_23963:171-863(-)
MSQLGKWPPLADELPWVLGHKLAFLAQLSTDGPCRPPAARRSRTASSCPLRIASSSAVRFQLSEALTLTHTSVARYSRRFMALLAAAMWSAVVPLMLRLFTLSKSMSYFWMHSRKLLTWSILACSSIIAIPRALFKMSSSNCVSCSADSTSSGTVSVLYEDAREGLLAAKSSRLLECAVRVGVLVTVSSQLFPNRFRSAEPCEPDSVATTYTAALPSLSMPTSTVDCGAP